MEDYYDILHKIENLKETCKDNPEALVELDKLYKMLDKHYDKLIKSIESVVNIVHPGWSSSSIGC